MSVTEVGVLVVIVFLRVDRRQPVKLSSLIIAASLSLAAASAHAEPPLTPDMVATRKEDLTMAWHGMAWHGMAWHGMAWQHGLHTVARGSISDVGDR
jgi:hypothetical protein